MVNLVVEVQCQGMHPMERNWEKHFPTFIVVTLGMCKWYYAWQELLIIITETLKIT